ncbi:MAG: protein kinase [Planctomycetia bacterium]|nr:protein kinase [Planctomycetia bacterium]
MSEKEHKADSALEAHEEQIRKFEDAWQLGSRPRIEDYLPNDERARCAVLFELVQIDLENRIKRGDSFQVDEYLAAFSELASSPEAAELVAAEYELRRGHGSDATQEEYLNRFPELAERLRARWTDAKHRGDGRFPLRLNCPHCRNPIEIVEAEDADVICPSCGSSFMLDADRTQSWSPEKLPTLGKFRLEKAVGRGAFGTVYRARDTELDRVVAVKIPRSGKLATQEDEDRFIREARSVAQLQHPSIVAVHEVGRSDTFPYIVADFVEGITLADALTGKQYSFREAAKLIAKVAEAVDHAHQNGVIHRDLKPSNIMLTSASQTADDSFDSGVRR